jgi:hypothetical protein
MNYSKVRDALKVGDQVGFSGNSRFSRAIKQVQFAHARRAGVPLPWHISHVATVLRTKVNGSERVMIIESTTDVTLPDAETKKLFKGVQLHFLSNRLATYDGDLYLYPLRNNVTAEQEKRMVDWATKKHHEGCMYDAAQAVGAGLDFWDRFCENAEDFSRLFCSELSTKLLKEAGQLPQDVNASEQMPMDVCASKPICGAGCLIAWDGGPWNAQATPGSA